MEMRRFVPLDAHTEIPRHIGSSIPSYFERNFSVTDRAVAENYAHQMQERTGDGRKKFAKNIVVIPTAHDERASTLHHCASVYARQPTDRGLTLVFGLDRPVGEDLNIDHIAAIERAKRHFPDLDIRTVDMGEHQTHTEDGEKIPCVIPGLVKKLIGGVLLTIQEDPTPEDDYMLYFQGVDIQRLSPNYFQRMDEVHNANPSKPLMSYGEHSIYPTKPNISNGIIFCDMYDIFTEDVPIFEAAMGIPVPKYCELDGITDNSQVGQVISLLGRAKDELIYVDDIALVSSGRRHADKFAKKTGVIWAEEFEYRGLSYRSSRPTKDIDGATMNNITQSEQVSNILRFQEVFTQFISRRLDAGVPFDEIRDQMWDWVRPRLAQYYESYLRRSQLFPTGEEMTAQEFREYMEGKTEIDERINRSWGLYFLATVHESAVKSLLQFVNHRDLQDYGGFPVINKGMKEWIEGLITHKRLSGYVRYDPYIRLFLPPREEK